MNLWLVYLNKKNLNLKSGLKKTLNYLTQQPSVQSVNETKSGLNLSIRNLLDINKSSNVISSSLSNLNASSSMVCAICKMPINLNSLLGIKWNLFNNGNNNSNETKCNDCNQLTCKVSLLASSFFSAFFWLLFDLFYCFFCTKRNAVNRWVK